MPHPIVHFEVMGPDGLALQAFYRDLFAWDINNMADMGNYGIVDTKGGAGMNGAVGASQDGAPFTTIYVEVPNPQATLEQIETLGGKVLVPVTEIPDVVTFAIFVDPFGHAIGLVKGDGTGDGVSAGAGIAVDWFEILGAEPTKILDFYTTVFGWATKGMSTPAISPEMEYHEVTTVGGAYGTNGGIGTSRDGTPVTTIYAHVPDVAQYLEKAKALGGTPVMGPMEVPNGPTIGAFKDPAGNLFGVYSGM